MNTEEEQKEEVIDKEVIKPRKYIVDSHGIVHFIEDNNT